MGEPVEKVASPGSAADGERGGSGYRAEAVHDAYDVSGRRGVEESPQASEEIVIEEISIDGMCGVY